MRILYVGQLWEGGTCAERLKTLRSLGYEVTSYDTSRWLRFGNRIMLSISHRLNWGPIVWQLNQALLNHIASVKKSDLIWIDKGIWITSQTLAEIRRLTGAMLLHYSPDAHFYANRSHLLLAAIPEYDFIVTTKSFEVEYYNKYDAKAVCLILQGYDPRFEHYVRFSRFYDQWETDTAFIGHCQPHYARTLKGLSSCNVHLSIWGPRWPRYARIHYWARRHVKGSGLWGDDYMHALASTKIGIGLLGKHIPETTTTRSFEIPAIGTFLLAERTDDHTALYKEGVEAEFFDSVEELQDKALYYLRHDSARSRIAAAGKKRSVKSNYSNRYQLLKVLQMLD